MRQDSDSQATQIYLYTTVVRYVSLQKLPSALSVGEVCWYGPVHCSTLDGGHAVGLANSHAVTQFLKLRVLSLSLHPKGFTSVWACTPEWVHTN